MLAPPHASWWALGSEAPSSRREVKWRKSILAVVAGAGTLGHHRPEHGRGRGVKALPFANMSS